MSAAIDFLTTLAGRLQTQDNCYTASPNYCIQENRLFCGIDEDYGGEIGWFNNDGDGMAEGRKAKALERYYDRYSKEPSNWTRCGYKNIWQYSGVSFLTKDAADAYVKHNAHKHEYEIRVYVDSHYRNHEMCEVRRLLAGPVANCLALLREARSSLADGLEPEAFGESESSMADRVLVRYIDTALEVLDTAKEPHR